MSNTRLLVLGLQSSGKTTFAAALWHLVDSREVVTRLEKGLHNGDFSYLEKIAQSWSEGWQIGRTNANEIEAVRINLRNPVDQEQIALEFTDLAGETFEAAFATRLCEERLVDLVKSTDGLLLFVSALRTIDDVTILDALGDSDDEGDDEAEQTVQVQDGEIAPEPAVAPLTEENPDVVGSHSAWEPKSTPLQIQLVDLLQSLKRDPFNKGTPKVAVVISAWDLSDGSSPEVWLARRYPLLDQYLKGPEGSIQTRVFGVSAQGGPLSKKGETPPPSRDQLLAVVPASKRISIVGPGAGAHDLTQPIAWLGGLEA